MKIIYNTSKMEMFRLFRNQYFVVFSLLMPFIFYAIYTTTVSGTMEIAGTEWKAYFLISMTCFSLMGSSVTTMGIQLLYDRRQPWMKWVQSLPMKRMQYFTARLVSLMVLNGMIIIALFTAASVWKGIELPLMKWVQVGGWIWLGILPFLALGLWISVFKTPDTATGVANLLTLGMALLGGLWTPMDNMPAFVQSFGTWTPGYLYANGAWSLLAGEAVPLVTIVVLLAYLVIFAGGALYTHARRI
ncbi:ABC transporter permease [Halobacillus litoralis]|uniref:ABC transporter permease n=1 Tax=Halobacillus litoralis TaxID=45668 RepID=UPI001CD367DB|nr:ABC transporter permease [Halobacillus litoralis]MCA0972330.1 ABC transporter permease [Halobacillus litoralis]